MWRSTSAPYCLVLNKKTKILMTCLPGSHKLAVFIFCSSACIFCCICWLACSSYVQSCQHRSGKSISQSLPRQPFTDGRLWFGHTNLPSVRGRALCLGSTVLQKAQQTFVLSSMEIFKVQCSTTGAMQIWSQTAFAHKESLRHAKPNINDLFCPSSFSVQPSSAQGINA